MTIKKKSKGRRPLKVKARLEVMIRASSQEEAPGKVEPRRKPRRGGPEDEFEPAVVEVNAITYEEG